MSRFDPLDLFYGVVFLAVLFLALGLFDLYGLRRAARAGQRPYDVRWMWQEMKIDYPG